MTNIRCKKCNRLLMKANIVGGIEVKCSKCGYVNCFILIEGASVAKIVDMEKEREEVINA